MNDNVTLSAPQRRAIAALMTAKDTRAAARIASVSERQSIPLAHPARVCG